MPFYRCAVHLGTLFGEATDKAANGLILLGELLCGLTSTQASSRANYFGENPASKQKAGLINY